jgi:deoxyribonuclease II
LYNDEPPEGKTDGSRGHTKGVLATNAQQGFWLIHSVPHYPAALDNGTYWYPHTGRTYGQSFLCITIGASEVEKVGTQLLYNEPHIYSTKFPEAYE